MKQFWLYVATLSSFFGSHGYAFSESKALYQINTPSIRALHGDDLLVAQNQSGERKKNVDTEQVKTYNRGDKTEFDLEESVLEGSSRTPALSTISSNRPNMDYNFVKIRQKWHSEMIQSTSSLDTKN